MQFSVPQGRGSMLIVQSTKASGDVDTLTSHQSCNGPVTEGENVNTLRFSRQDTCNLNKCCSKRK